MESGQRRGRLHRKEKMMNWNEYIEQVKEDAKESIK